jgi:hypothetical protein
MRHRLAFEISTADTPHEFRRVRETDIRDYYVPSPIAATGSLWPVLRTPAVPLPSRRLVRRGRD